MASRAFGNEINQDNRTNLGDQDNDDASTVIAPAAPTRVAHLRSFLDDFGRKNKEHFEKSMVTSANADVQKSPVLRPKIRRSVESGPTPLPNEAASVLVRRIMKPTAPGPNATSKFKKFREEEREKVEATDEGYASVEKLCKWLADDPTSTKKLRHLRRGSNVLAKSRAFEKGLANTIEVENKIKHGSVAAHRKQFDRRDTIGVPTARKNCSVKKNSAASDLLTRHDDYMAKAETVKRQWRDRIQHQAVKKDEELKDVPKRDDETCSVNKDVLCSQADSGGTEVLEAALTNSGVLLDQILTDNEHDEPSIFLDTPSECSQATVEASLPPSRSSENMDFRQIRDMVVKRSESNGSSDEMVQLRKKKFEKLQKDMRRKTGTHGLLKASWDFVEEGNYVKKFVSDIPPKRSLHDLP